MAEDKPQKSRNVARAARAAQSSRPGQQRRNYAFPAVIVAIVVLGLVLVAYGRSVRTDDSPVPTLDTLPPSETTTLDDETTDEGADDDATTDEGADDGTTDEGADDEGADGETSEDEPTTTTTDENDASG